MMARALTIAGSDSGGGAGIQADLRTFAVLGVHGMSAVTAVTAQNTLGVTSVHVLPPEAASAQIDAVATDIGIDAAKTGMLADRAIVGAVAESVRRHGLSPLVVDPVMVAESGARLLDADAIAAMREDLFPLAALVTPNAQEAAALLGRRVASVEDMHEAARRLMETGAGAVLVKGGHVEGVDAIDVFHDGREARELRAGRIHTRDTHGTGCILSAAITARLAAGDSLLPAVEFGKRFVTIAIRGAVRLGAGAAPANPLAWLDERLRR